MSFQIIIVLNFGVIMVAVEPSVCFWTGATKSIPLRIFLTVLHITPQRASRKLNSSLHIASRNCFATVDLQYRETIGEPSAAAARINRFLGGTLDEGAMMAVVNPDLYRIRAGS